MINRTSRIGTLALLTLAAAAFDLEAQFAGRGALPLVPGDAIPSVGGFTEEGSPISLESLKGQPTVIAFGCLT